MNQKSAFKDLRGNGKVEKQKKLRLCKESMLFRVPRFVKMESLFLFVEFDDGYKVLYDVKDDIKTLPSFRALVDVYGLFKQAQLDTSRTCVYWNDKINLASDSIYEYGKAA